MLKPTSLSDGLFSTRWAPSVGRTCRDPLCLLSFETLHYLSIAVTGSLQPLGDRKVHLDEAASLCFLGKFHRVCHCGGVRPQFVISPEQFGRRQRRRRQIFVFIVHVLRSERTACRISIIASHMMFPTGTYRVADCPPLELFVATGTCYVACRVPTVTYPAGGACIPAGSYGCMYNLADCIPAGSYGYMYNLCLLYPDCG